MCLTLSLEFPPEDAFRHGNAIFITFLIGVTLAVALASTNIFVARRTGAKEVGGMQVGGWYIILLGSLVLGAGAGLAMVSMEQNVEKFWKLSPKDVHSIRIFPLDDDVVRKTTVASSAQILEITNNGEIARALATLEASTGRIDKSHDGFRGGHVVELCMVDGAKLYIVAGKADAIGQGAYAVGPRTTLNDLALGVYRNQQFHEWLQETIRDTE